MKYEEEIREFVEEGDELVEEWVSKNEAQITVWETQEGLFKVVRAFYLDGNIAVSVDKNGETATDLLVELLKERYGEVK